MNKFKIAFHFIKIQLKNIGNILIKTSLESFAESH